MQVPNSFGAFGGLRLDVPIDEVPPEQAIDLLDVDWIDSGGLGSRRGATLFSKSSEYVRGLFRHSPTVLLTSRGSTLVAVGGSGAEGATKAATGLGFTLSFARFGTPTTSYTYLGGTEEATDTLWRYSGSFSQPTATVDGEAGKAMPTGGWLSTWPDGGNRLVIAGPEVGPNGAPSSTSKVWFSEPGNAEGYESTSYVQLSPGDGEKVVGCCRWGGMIFVFKQTRLFVFYGVSTDEEGKPIFNFRTVELPSRVLAATSGQDGVYFTTVSGLWITTGGSATYLSQALAPLANPLFQEISGPAQATFGIERWSNSFDRQPFFWRQRLYIPGDAHLLVYDVERGEWLVWRADSIRGMAAWEHGSTANEEELFFIDANPGAVYRYSFEAATDASVSMDPRWQSGFYDLSSEDEKSLVDARLWGSGTVSFKHAKDFGSLGAAKTYALGTGIGQARAQATQTGTLFSHQFSGPGPWSVQRLIRYQRESRVPESKTP